MARQNKIIILFLKVLVSSGLLYLVISKTGADKVVSALKDIDIFYFLLAVLTYVFCISISTIRWRLLLPERFEFKRLFSLYFIGSFFNHLLPGIVGGDAVKAYYVYKETGNGTSAVASVFMDRYIGFTALIFVGLAAFPFGFGYLKGSYIEWILPLLAVLFIGGSFMILGLRIGQRIKFLSGLYEHFALYKKKRGVIVKTLLISLAVQTTVIFAVYIISVGLRTGVPLLPLFIFVPIVTAVASIPISISGIGVREASFVLLLGTLGISPAQATAVSFAWFLSYVTGSLPGLVEYLRYKKQSTPSP